MGKVIEARRWYCERNGLTASVTGACPWHNETERAWWRMETVGWTIQHPDGTIGIGRPPFATREEAQAWVDAHPRFPGMNQG